MLQISNKLLLFVRRENGTLELEVSPTTRKRKLSQAARTMEMPSLTKKQKVLQANREMEHDGDSVRKRIVKQCLGK